MRVTVVGAGAMGSLFGGLLAAVSQVTLLDPWAEHVRAICEHGLQLSGLCGERIVPVAATTDPQDAAPADLALIFVKSGQTPWAANIAAQILTPVGLALTVQNGLGNAEVLENTLGRARVCAGVTNCAATLLGPGRVRQAGNGVTHLAVTPENEGSVRLAADLLRAAGFAVELSANLDSMVWGKLIANVGLNAVTAIVRVQTGQVNRIAPLRGLMEAAVREAAAVAAARGIRLPYDDPVAYVSGLAEATQANRTSMLQDVLRGAPTEIEVMNGAIVREGARVGVLTPVNQVLLALVRAIEAAYDVRV